MIGLRKAFQVAANVPFTSSVALLTVGLTSAIAAGQTQHVRAWIPLTVGATGGIRAQIVVPAAGTLFEATIKLYNTVAPSLTTAIQNASAAFTNALASAGSHWLEIEAYVLNGVNAGNVDIQLAQNTTDVLTMTVLKGGFMDVHFY
jgi:hypothetical protein